LQEIHLDDDKLGLRNVLKEDGYDCHYNCCKTKKGYSGTAVFVKRRRGGGGGETTKKQATLTNFFGAKKTKTKTTTVPKGKGSKQPPPTTNDADAAADDDDPFTPLLIPQKITNTFHKNHDAEGRVITVHYPLFTLLNLYVPNSGAKLERLSYRTSQWDEDIITHYNQLQSSSTPIIATGDLNVAHRAYDVWNDGATHLKTQAGTTPEERDSFGRIMAECGLKDAFRSLHGEEARGYYTYWSQRAGNRAPNKGLRLDYFLVSEGLLSSSGMVGGGGGGDGDGDGARVTVRDCFMISDQMGSDHCPILLEMEIKKG